MTSERTHSIIRVETKLSPWSTNRWEFEKQTCKPMLKTLDDYDPDIALTAEELVTLMYLYFTRREIIGVSTISYQELAGVLGYQNNKNTSRISQKMQSVIEGLLNKCTPTNNLSVAVIKESNGVPGWEKIIYIRVVPVALTALKSQREQVVTYLQIDNLEFSKIWHASIMSGKPFSKLFIVYMYMKTFFSPTKKLNNFVGWGGWRNSQLAEKDLHMGYSKFRELREILVEYQVLYRNEINNALYATVDDNNLWAEIGGRFPYRWRKKPENLGHNTNEVTALMKEANQFII